MSHPIMQQFRQARVDGRIMAFEFIDQNTDEDYLINLDCLETGIWFDTPSYQKMTHFSGRIKPCDGGWFMHFDDYGLDTLERYLEEIHTELMEGFFLVHGIEV